MRIDLGLILAVALEYIAFIYYSNTLFYRKRSIAFCGAVTIIGYTIHFIICIFGNVSVNLISFAALNIVLFISCFYISNKTAVFQGTILVLLSTVCELIANHVFKLGINTNNLIDVSATQSIILTVSGKTLYLVGIMILSYVFRKDNKYTNIYSMLLIIIPIITIAMLIFVVRFSVNNYLQLIICALCILIDVIVFIINQSIITQSLEIEALKLQLEKDKQNFKDCMMLKHLDHDMDEHLDALYSLIDHDNTQAKEYINSIKSEKQKLTNVVDYTDNTMINIVLSKKMNECNEKGIKFSLDPVLSELKFFKGMDAVTIFSNLINNAIESCENSSEKKIYMKIYTVNKNFVVIKIENSSDKKPLVIDGKLKTHKNNEQLHGIGINNIKQALKKYNGTLSWSYDEQMKRFCIMITIQHITKQHLVSNEKSHI